MGERIESFRDLTVYKRGFELQGGIFELTKRFPKEALYSLTDQIRRSSPEIGDVLYWSDLRSLDWRVTFLRGE